MQVNGGNRVVDHVAVGAIVLRRDLGGDHFASSGESVLWCFIAGAVRAWTATHNARHQLAPDSRAYP
jgi:hypothetical protein